MDFSPFANFAYCASLCLLRHGEGESAGVALGAGVHKERLCGFGPGLAVLHSGKSKLG